MASRGLASPPDQSLSHRASTAERSVASVSIVYAANELVS